MQSILLNTGKAALARAVAEGRKLKVAAYRIGQAANFTPVVTDINVKPTSVYQGDAATVSTSLINQDEVRYTLTLIEPIGPFNVGNIMLFLADDVGGSNTLIPYLFGVLPTAVAKYKNNPPASIGNRLVFNMTAKYTNVSEAFELKIVTPLYASLPNYRDEYDLPAPGSASYQQMILQNNTRTGTPAVAVRREMDNAFFIAPFMQRLDDPGFGGLRGGVVGDRYLPFYGNYYAGGLYNMPTAAFTDNLDGGDGWGAPGEADLPVDGGSYN